MNLNEFHSFENILDNKKKVISKEIKIKVILLRFSKKYGQFFILYFMKILFRNVKKKTLKVCA